MESIILNPNNDFKKNIIFDLDHTLIKPKSGNVYPKDNDDWVWWNDMVPLKLLELSRAGYKIIIVSNQSKKKAKDVLEKIIVIFSNIEISVIAYVCYGDEYRKPCTRVIRESELEIKNIELFCGDAVGREGDFSDSDARFAYNLRIPITTPDEYFLNKEIFYSIPPALSIGKHKKIKIDKSCNHVLLMCGYPASGKSHFVNTFCADYIVISQDKCKSLKKTQTMFLDSIGKGFMVVDNTFPNKKSREWFVEMTLKNNIPVYCVYCTTPINVANHLNYYRTEKAINNPKCIPKVAYYLFRKNFEKPDISEGFTKVYNYTPDIPIEILRDYRYPLI